MLPGNTGAKPERTMPKALQQHLTASGFDSGSDYDAVVDAAADWWSTENPGWDWEATSAHAEWTADAVCYGRSIWG